MQTGPRHRKFRKRLHGSSDRDARVNPAGGAVERPGGGDVAVAGGVDEVDPDARALWIGDTVRLDVDVRLGREPHLA